MAEKKAGCAVRRPLVGGPRRDRTSRRFTALEMWKNVEEMGGLHIVGTERHESRRIDNQLRGRAGRQGDNGSSRFFLSTGGRPDEDLRRQGDAERAVDARHEGRRRPRGPRMLTRSIEKAQRKVEERNFQMRKNILEYDEPMEHQRARCSTACASRSSRARGVRDLALRYVDDVDREGRRRLPRPDARAQHRISEWVREHCGVSDRSRSLPEEAIAKRSRGSSASTPPRKRRSRSARPQASAFRSSSSPEEWDAEGFAAWARAQLRRRDSRPSEMLAAADRSEAIEDGRGGGAHAKFARDRPFAARANSSCRNFGATQLASWANCASSA
jgi:preprotein translocase subunit SecA